MKIHFSMTLTGNMMLVEKLQETFGTVYAAIGKKKKEKAQTQNLNIFPGCDQVITLIAQCRSTRRAAARL